jgi:hypothetical protein
MLRSVRKLDISFCPKIVDLSRLLSLTDLAAIGATNVNLQSGFQTFSNLKNLRMGRMGRFAEIPFAEGISNSPLRSLCLLAMEVFEVSPMLTNLKYLISLVLCGLRGNLTIPEISTLGYLKIDDSAIRTLLIQGHNESYPIYYVEIMDCTELEKIFVKRPISFMKLCFCGVNRLNIDGEENIKDRFFKEI